MTLRRSHLGYIGAILGVGSVRARRFISVPARIALRPRRAKDVGVRTLRLAAFAVWLVTVVSVAVAALQVLDLLPTTRLDWLPAWIVPFFALAVLTPASVGLLIAIRRHYRDLDAPIVRSEDGMSDTNIAIAS